MICQYKRSEAQDKLVTTCSSHKLLLQIRPCEHASEKNWEEIKYNIVKGNKCIDAEKAVPLFIKAILLS